MKIWEEVGHVGNLSNMRWIGGKVKMARISGATSVRTRIKWKKCKKIGTHHNGVIGEVSPPAVHSVANTRIGYFRTLQRLAFFRIRLGRLASDREQPDHTVMEQSAPRLRQRPVVSRG